MRKYLNMGCKITGSITPLSLPLLLTGILPWFSANILNWRMLHSFSAIWLIPSLFSWKMAMETLPAVLMRSSRKSLLEKSCEIDTLQECDLLCKVNIAKDKGSTAPTNRALNLPPNDTTISQSRLVQYFPNELEKFPENPWAITSNFRLKYWLQTIP